MKIFERLVKHRNKMDADELLSYIDLNLPVDPAPFEKLDSYPPLSNFAPFWWQLHYMQIFKETAPDGQPIATKKKLKVVDSRVADDSAILIVEITGQLDGDRQGRVVMLEANRIRGLWQFHAEALLYIELMPFPGRWTGAEDSRAPQSLRAWASKRRSELNKPFSALASARPRPRGSRAGARSTDGVAILLIGVAECREPFEVEILRQSEDRIWNFTSNLSFEERKDLYPLRRWAITEAEKIRKESDAHIQGPG